MENLKFLNNTTKLPLIIAVALFFVAFENFSFYKNVLNVYPLNLENSGFIASLTVVLISGIIILLTLLSSRYIIKPAIIFFLWVTSLTTYFMDSYGVVIDDDMIDNMMQTNIDESFDLLNIKLVSYVFFLAVLPSIYVFRVKIHYKKFTTEFFSSLKIIAISLVIAVAVALPLTKFYASFIREHKPLRYYTNPTYYIYSTIYYFNTLFKSNVNKVITPIGLDAHIAETNTDRELIILVVGETARADRFSLNGYDKKTNPLLEKEGVVSFSDFYSCGTSTAISVPCMFSLMNRSNFSKSKFKQSENLLDVLDRAGVNVLWLDNNSDSKGVALRVDYESYKTAKNNTICDDECRDEGMLIRVQDYINKHDKGDILIVLHQMGNHGPAYYKRYPESFEQFKPICKTNQLEKCSIEEISNAYDNAILYTDYFLSKTIDVLKQNSPAFKTALFYVSDHGESLGENGLYLHGLPYIMAPDTQTHVGVIMWFDEKFKDNKAAVLAKKEQTFTHDNVFHTVLGFFDVVTSVYNSKMDIVNN